MRYDLVVIAGAMWVVCGVLQAAPPASHPAAGSETEGLLAGIEQLTTPAMGFDKAGEAYFSPDGRQIIFQAVPAGREGYQIYTMTLSERRPRMVSTGRGECTCAFFRPDGKKIIFASSHLDPDLDRPKPATQPSGGRAGVSPALSGTGAPVALPPLGKGAQGTQPAGYRVGQRSYVWNFNPHMDIFEADPDGSHLRRLTDAPGYDAEGAYGPDGEQIVFTSQRSGDLEIWSMGADDGNQRQITRAKGYDGGPFISPDGKRIIWRADRRGDDKLQIFVADIDGRHERQLTENDFVNWGPYWHPGGRSIIYATSRHGHQNYELYLLNVDTGSQRRVTFTEGFDGLPVFSPDGRKLMWTSKRGPDRTSQIFIADFKLPGGF